MSTLASFSPAPATRRKAPPVTAHPWFPTIVALWFAALLGLSSLVLAPAMLERLVAASRIDGVIAAAAPPLGQTARLLVALGLAGLGSVFGLVLGRVIAGRSRRAGRGDNVVYAPSVERSDDDSPGEVSGDTGEPRMGVRDRLAKLTGQGDGPRDFDDLPRLRSRDRHPDAPGRKPLTPSEDLVGDAEAPGEDSGPATIEYSLPDESQVAEFASVPPPFGPPVSVDCGGWPVPGKFAEPVAARIDAAEVAAIEPGVVVDGEPPEPDTITREEPPLLLCAPASPPLEIERAPLDSLGVVQLTERLAISMRERRERDARRAATRAQSAPVEDPPLGLTALVLAHPPENAPTRPAHEVSAEPRHADPEALETGYSSLLALSRKPAEPIAVFPGASPAPFAAPSTAAPSAANNAVDDKDDVAATSTHDRTVDPAETYRALKSALDSLQRVSGTG